jgi:hypothetical protein
MKYKYKQMQKQEQQFRLSMSSMKNQIHEVIKEDLNESVRSNTNRSQRFMEVLEVEDSVENGMLP